MKLEIAKEYYVDAAHLKNVISAQDSSRYMQNIDHLKELEKILVMEDAGGWKTVKVIPAMVHRIIFGNSVNKEARVKVCVDLKELGPLLFAVVDSDKIYKEVSEPEAAKKVDNGQTWYYNLDPYNYTPKRIIYNNPATIVFWRDGTKTIVKKNEKEKYNSYNAFCAALAKKIFGTNSEVNRIVRSGYNQKVAEGQKKFADFKKKVEKARKEKKKGEKK